MRPDDKHSMRPLNDAFDPAGLDLPADVDLAALEAELSAAGSRARRGTPAAPTAAFTASLRKRLISAYVPATDMASVAGSSRARGLHAAPAAMTARRASEPAIHAPVALRARVERRTPSVLPAPKWSFLAVAAALIVAVVGLKGTPARPLPAETRVASAVGAVLVRAGQQRELTSGMALAEGDEVRVAAGGAATLQLGDSLARLAAGADLRIVTMNRTDIELDQVSGRAWHRVVVPDGGHYRVTTGDVRWTAVGTAFDLARSPGTAGDTVRELSIQRAVIAEGPGLLVTIGEGRGATVVLGSTPTVATAAVTQTAALADSWLVRNAGDDLAAGYGVGMLDGAPLDTADRTPEPTTGLPSPVPSAEPTATPESTAGPTASPSPHPTARPTLRPTAEPTPAPTPRPTLGTMSLTVSACPGAVRFAWTLPELADLDHVQVIRGSSPEIPVTWPPAAGTTAFDSGYVAGGSVREAFDAGIDGGAQAWYRALALDAENRPLAASSVQGASALGIVGLGSLGVANGPEAGQLQFSWSPFTASGDCFSFYKIVASADDPTPSYLTGASYLAAIGDQAAAGTTVAGLTSGQTLWFRVQAIREIGAGKFVSAQTDPVQFTVP